MNKKKKLPANRSWSKCCATANKKWSGINLSTIRDPVSRSGDLPVTLIFFFFYRFLQNLKYSWLLFVQTTDPKTKTQYSWWTILVLRSEYYTNIPGSERWFTLIQKYCWKRNSVAFLKSGLHELQVLYFRSMYGNILQQWKSRTLTQQTKQKIHTCV